MRRQERAGTYIQSAIFGVLDVFLVEAWPNSLRNIRVTLLDLTIDPLEASDFAFRMAGRDAARKVLAATSQ